jgi:hypothetical protein
MSVDFQRTTWRFISYNRSLQQICVSAASDKISARRFPSNFTEATFNTSVCPNHRTNAI